MHFKGYLFWGFPPAYIHSTKLPLSRGLWLFSQAAAVIAADAGRPCGRAIITEALGFGIKTESIWMLKRLLLVLNYLEHSHCF